MCPQQDIVKCIGEPYGSDANAATMVVVIPDDICTIYGA
jgi:hypothetical protein